MLKTYETRVTTGSDGSTYILVRYMLRQWDPDKGHHWAERPTRVAFNYWSTENLQDAVRIAWPEAKSVEWIGNTAGGSLFLASDE